MRERVREIAYRRGREKERMFELYELSRILFYKPILCALPCTVDTVNFCPVYTFTVASHTTSRVYLLGSCTTLPMMQHRNE